MDQELRSRRRRVLPAVPPALVEGAAMLIALAVSFLVVAVLAASPRAAMLYYDGDSLLPALVRASRAVGQPQDWALSSPLFLPEVGQYLAIAATGLSVHATIALNGVVNLLAYFLAIRLVVAALAPRLRRGPAVALVAFSLFAICVVLEPTGDRDALDLASLLTTGTYYSATVVACVLTLALTAAIVRSSPTRHRGLLWMALAVLAACSTLTNPIYVAWAVAPVGIVLLALCVARTVPIRRSLAVCAALLVGVGVGLLGRIPFTRFLTQDAGAKVQPAAAGASARYYGALLADRLHTVPGLIEFLIVVGLLTLAVVSTIVEIRRRNASAAFVSCAAWLIPLVVVVGAVATGTVAARYVQPAVFLPVLAVLPMLTRPKPASIRVPSRTRRVGMVVVCVACGITMGAAIGVAPALVHPAPGIDSAVACTDRWIESSGEHGAGQYWTVRAPKAYLRDPRLLVQTGPSLDGYAWLVNRADFSVARVSFLVEDGESPAFVVPAGIGPPEHVVRCGRYTISDWGHPVLPIGAARSSL